MTAFAEAFTKAGIDTSASRLAVAAHDILARFGISPRKARDEFCALLRRNDDLFGTLAELYLDQRAADMRGESLAGGGQGGGARKGHFAPVPAGQPVGGDGGHAAGASVSERVPPSPPPKADRGGQAPAAQAQRALPPRSAPPSPGAKILSGMREAVKIVRGEAEPARVYGDPAPWRPLAVKPRVAPIPAASLAMVQKAFPKSVMDTYRVRGGTPIGDLGWSEAKSLARLNEGEARVLRYITDHVANADPGALVRHVVKVEVVEAAIRHAGEAADAEA